MCSGPTPLPGWHPDRRQRRVAGTFVVRDVAGGAGVPAGVPDPPAEQDGVLVKVDGGAALRAVPPQVPSLEGLEAVEAAPVEGDDIAVHSAALVAAADVLGAFEPADAGVVTLGCALPTARPAWPLPRAGLAHHQMAHAMALPMRPGSTTGAAT